MPNKLHKWRLKVWCLVGLTFKLFGTSNFIAEKRIHG